MVKIQEGDRVRKRYGKKAMIVETIYGRRANCVYEHSGSCVSDLIDNLVHFNDEDDQYQKGNSGMKGKLFQTKKKDDRGNAERFGIGLAINAKGMYVLDMKDTGLPEAFNKNEIEVVTPYTFEVEWNQGNKTHYLGAEGEVEVGDILLKSDKTKGVNFAKVTALNTKAENAKRYFEGVKIMTAPILNGE